MTDTPWTPGPWEVATIQASPFLAAIDGSVADPTSFAPQVADAVRSAADARLIAAAPEMAELLAVAKNVNTFEHFQDWGRKADALLSRIRGEV